MEAVSYWEALGAVAVVEYSDCTGCYSYCGTCGEESGYCRSSLEWPVGTVKVGRADAECVSCCHSCGYAGEYESYVPEAVDGSVESVLSLGASCGGA